MKKEEKIIAIDPGTHFQGIAVFQGEELIISLVKILNLKGSREKRLKEIRKVFSSLIEDYAPDVLAIERSIFSLTRQSKLLEAIINEIKFLAGKERIKVCEFSPLAVRKIICGNDRAAKKDVAKLAASIYPELKNRLEEDQKSDYPELKNHLNQDPKSDHAKLEIMLSQDKRKNKQRLGKIREKYWSHMFDAVGLGICYLKTRRK
ncbi:MAG: crossover junction endodeoxyribonuclease RuvC [bacterium]|nr:crossover junction endodeoxyribonuclease RuvC [bacterium]